ncbi:EAL domain-containing protein [Serratia ficaria]|uniref:EAL domain-containing protein n=1 Tax=Serratia ficaria TaxID=61651 RepID=UPI00077CB6D1|nr:EAL domain-containing protein [Serratia ficaria]MEE4481872.1 EAL domain-containing protein [Serratia ficaria]CAI0737956.1 phage resistance protein [Serratia ficaria]CAI0783663.1 phage resistance protein [Serratia ficaria]CAI1623069.1 phage resistance protein [Serratia ficaria]CAI2405804.1 phage resistance protein [Serratia ficaria]
MLMTHLAASQYRYYRWLLAGAVGLAILLISLYTRYYQEVTNIEQSQQALATRTVAKINQLLQPAELQAGRSMPLLEQSCESAMPTLRFRAAQNQALRSMLLVKNDKIYCSSLFGARDYQFAAVLPSIANGGARLALRPSLAVSRGVPTLVMWTPSASDKNSGVLHVFNIELLANFLLEPQEPYAQRVVLNVADNSLEYGRREILNRDTLTADLRYTANSAKYPFSVSLFGPPVGMLALAALPRHIPLALLVSLLAAYVVYLLTANRMSLAYHIGHAITHREFRVYCQPIINSDTGRCSGVEMLLRWKKKRQGWISPDVFIPLAEQHELIIPLTRYLMNTVVENLQLFPPRPSFYISINVAAEHFNAVNIIDDIRQIWLPAQPMPSLMLELTERTALSAIQYEQIKTLKEMGIMLAIDDFGTGHSSLSYLKNLSPDVLKIDRGFTAAIGTDAVNATVTDTIILLAQRLKLKLVAEGVETEEQADYLRAREVNALQGYYFAKPMPIHVFPLWLRQYESRLRTGAEPEGQANQPEA